MAVTGSTRLLGQPARDARKTAKKLAAMIDPKLDQLPPAQRKRKQQEIIAILEGKAAK